MQTTRSSSRTTRRQSRYTLLTEVRTLVQQALANGSSTGDGHLLQLQHGVERAIRAEWRGRTRGEAFDRALRGGRLRSEGGNTAILDEEADSDAGAQQDWVAENGENGREVVLHEGGENMNSNLTDEGMASNSNTEDFQYARDLRRTTAPEPDQSLREAFHVRSQTADIFLESYLGLEAWTEPVENQERETGSPETDTVAPPPPAPDSHEKSVPETGSEESRNEEIWDTSFQRRTELQLIQGTRTTLLSQMRTDMMNYDLERERAFSREQGYQGYPSLSSPNPEETTPSNDGIHLRGRNEAHAEADSLSERGEQGSDTPTSNIGASLTSSFLPARIHFSAPQAFISLILTHRSLEHFRQVDSNGRVSWSTRFTDTDSREVTLQDWRDFTRQDWRDFYRSFGLIRLGRTGTRTAEIIQIAVQDGLNVREAIQLIACLRAFADVGQVTPTFPAIAAIWDTLHELWDDHTSGGWIPSERMHRRVYVEHWRLRDYDRIVQLHEGLPRSDWQTVDYHRFLPREPRLQLREEASRSTISVDEETFGSHRHCH